MTTNYIPAKYTFTPDLIRKDCILYRNPLNEKPLLTMCRGLCYMLCADSHTGGECPFYKSSETYNPDGTLKDGNEPIKATRTYANIISASHSGKRFSP